MEGDIEEDVAHGIKAGCMNWRYAYEVLRYKCISLNLLGRIYKTAIRPALFYGAKC